MNEKSKKILRYGFLSLVIFTFALFGGFIGTNLAQQMQADNGSEINANKTKENITQATDITKVAEKSSESVVEIRTETVARGRYMHDYVSEGAGSGVIISDDGYIITNYHVVEGASYVKVTLSDGEEYEAEYIGGDRKNDIAVLKIDAKKLTPATIGNSDGLVVGENVVAIGNPLGELGGTVTEGIISSTSREVNIDGVSMSLLQTSAAINPGNSGGGLFNIDGELIGIVNAKSSGNDIEGLGFAIPVNVAMDIAEKIVDAKR